MGGALAPTLPLPPDAAARPPPPPPPQRAAGAGGVLERPPHLRRLAAGTRAPILFAPRAPSSPAPPGAGTRSWCRLSCWGCAAAWRGSRARAPLRRCPLARWPCRLAARWQAPSQGRERRNGGGARRGCRPAGGRRRCARRGRRQRVRAAPSLHARSMALPHIVARGGQELLKQAHAARSAGLARGWVMRSRASVLRRATPWEPRHRRHYHPCTLTRVHVRVCLRSASPLVPGGAYSQRDARRRRAAACARSQQTGTCSLAPAHRTPFHALRRC